MLAAVSILAVLAAAVVLVLVLRRASSPTELHEADVVRLTRPSGNVTRLDDESERYE